MCGEVDFFWGNKSKVNLSYIFASPQYGKMFAKNDYLVEIR